jgi:formylglycine-generating enzyme required for sulfatase activity
VLASRFFYSFHRITIANCELEAISLATAGCFAIYRGENKTVRLDLTFTIVILFMLLRLSSAGAVIAQSPKTITNSIGMKLLLIPKGTFQMGSPPGEQGALDEEHQHEVTLTRDYYLGAFEVTQAQYMKIMEENPSRNSKVEVKRHPQAGQIFVELDRPDYPVDQVSWQSAGEFCDRLSNLPEEIQAGRQYRLPTEAEWEYACRAGSKSTYSFEESSESLFDYAWFSGNSNDQTHPVGQKKPNAWGLYDMHGNVWEWCSDLYGDYPKGAVSDPTGPTKGLNYVFRGGGYNYEAAKCRSAFRIGISSRFSVPNGGFRVALSPPEITQ